VFGRRRKPGEQERPQDEAAQLIAEGNRLEDRGEHAQACALYRQAIAMAPQLADAHLNLGIGLEASGDAAGAMACYEKALALEPRSAAANYNLGKLLYSRGAPDRARPLLARALEIRADFLDARLVHAYVLHAMGELPAAAAELAAVLRHRPGDLSLRVILAQIRQALGDLAGAAAELEVVLSIKPDWKEALYNYGTAVMAQGREPEAERALRRVLELDPDFRLAYRMLGSLLHRQGRIDELLELCRAGRDRRPGDLDLESFELFALLFSDGLSEEELFRRHRDFGERLEGAHTVRIGKGDRRRAKDRLRIGYLSGDLNYHPVGLFLLPVLERHDRDGFETYCYAVEGRRDEFTRRLAGAAHVWRDAGALSDEQLAELVRGDEIDILVDLAGHSGTSRLGVFARQPAPVQASWLGYLNTTGLSRIHYRITDRICDPEPLTQQWHTERLLRLPDSQWCYRPFVAAPHAQRPALSANGFVTFGSFNQAAKLSRRTLSLWAKILDGVPSARLLVAGVAKGAAEEVLRRRLLLAGADAARVQFAPFLPVKDYLQLYAQVDIALDPMPYSGGTTTCDALWMGVPVLTLPGRRSASRSAASVLTAAALTEWICQDEADYLRRALAFAADSDHLAALRLSLRERLRASPLMDERRFARSLEDAYRQMYRSQA
jgi:predicted O-linked N-acetylglucosamine transferase (SPINDLY family)